MPSHGDAPRAEGGLGSGIETLRGPPPPLVHTSSRGDEPPRRGVGLRRGEALGDVLRETLGVEYRDGSGDEARDAEGDVESFRRDEGVEPAKNRGVNGRGAISRSARVMATRPPHEICSCSSLTRMRSMMTRCVLSPVSDVAVVIVRVALGARIDRVVSKVSRASRTDASCGLVGRRDRRAQAGASCRVGRRERW